MQMALSKMKRGRARQEERSRQECKRKAELILNRRIFREALATLEENE